VVDSEIERFWHWFQQQARVLLSEDDMVVADKLHAALAAMDETIAVEVATASDQVREVIISGSGNPAAMQKVKSIVSGAPIDHSWRFIALKPPLGFHFKLDYGGTAVDASQLHFDPMEAVDHPELLGIMIYCSDSVAKIDGITDVMWHIVETGLGEEAAQSIAMIKVESETNRPDGAIQIHQLPDYLAWHSRRHPPQRPH